MKTSTLSKKIGNFMQFIDLGKPRFVLNFVSLNKTLCFGLLCQKKTIKTSLRRFRNKDGDLKHGID